MAEDAPDSADPESGDDRPGTRRIPVASREEWQHEGPSANMANGPNSGHHPSSRRGIFEDGRVIAGRYKILGIVGVGGMGTVYKAQDLQLDVLVALKAIRREIAHAPKILERFRREVKLARRVTHKNVARIHDIGEADGEPFLTMELVDGQCLEDLMTVDPMPLPSVLKIALPLCEGLAAAHDVGVVHRDLKPGNIMIGRDGRVVITDFGIARAVETENGSQTVGMVLGTPAYMAPEQHKGSADVDARADIFALGVLLFELCVGRRPFEDIPALSRHLAPPPDPEVFGVPAPVARAIIRCLELEPAARFASAHEVADALRLPQVAGRSLVEEKSPFSGREEPARLVVVLPFRNDGAPDDDYLGAGLTEELSDLLSAAPGLIVRPRGTTARFEALTRDVDVAVDDAGGPTVVDGSIRRTPGGLKIAARATDPVGALIWRKDFIIDPSALAAICDQVATEIVEVLTSGRIRLSRPSKGTATALDSYMRARYEYHAFESISSSAPLPALRAAVLKGVQLFDEAHALAPDDPKVLAGCVLAHTRAWFLGDDRPRTHGFVSAARAVELAPTRGEAYLARAVLQFQAGDLEAAIDDARLALSLAPYLAGAHELLGRVLGETGPVERGILHTRTAAELEPRFRSSRAALLRTYELAGNKDDADRLIDEVVTQDDGGVGWTALARVLMWRGDVVHAQSLIEHPVIQSGNAPSAREILRFMLEPERVPSAGKLVMSMLSAVGASWRMPIFLEQARTEFNASKRRFDQALASLAISVERGLVDVVWLDGCSLLHELRQDDRFPALRSNVQARVTPIRAALGGGEVL